MSVLLTRPVAAEEPPRERRLPAGWPLGLAVGAYPLWWALGVTPFLFLVTAVLLLLDLRGRDRLRVPPGFWMWLLFLVVVALSAVMLNVTAPGTVPPEGTSRYAAFGLRFLNYCAVTVFLLYIGNLGERELPRRRVMSWLAVLAVWTVLLGFAAIAFPRFEFPTALTLVLPESVLTLIGATGQDTAALAQVQPVLGVVSPRPAAPFAFTNAWGNNLSLMLVWVVAFAAVSGRRVRLAAGVLLVLAVVPIVYSLNRGVWIGIGLALLYLAVRLAARGRLLVLGALALVLGMSAIAFVASPLQTMVSARLDNGHSNDSRTSLASASLEAALSSPLLGYGSTRQTIGSDNSIAVGKTADCPKCGNRNVGSTGQYLLLLIAQGFTGLLLYIGFFARSWWAFRRDASPVGLAGGLVVLLTLFYGLFYEALLMPLVIAMLSVALLWRNAAARQGQGVSVTAPAAARRRRPSRQRR
ncbi:MAG TPA: O-antigen ligase family protein [Mycobacteriales bacterium]|jgi:hypothetical protein|nr:O-antigen ligase family protein [Mycobacteriales bacterium]